MRSRADVHRRDAAGFDRLDELAPCAEWKILAAPEAQTLGVTGGTTASRQPSDRYGFEFANYYTPAKNLAIDFDLANSNSPLHRN